VYSRWRRLGARRPAQISLSACSRLAQHVLWPAAAKDRVAKDTSQLHWSAPQSPLKRRRLDAGHDETGNAGRRTRLLQTAQPSRSNRRCTLELVVNFGAVVMATNSRLLTTPRLWTSFAPAQSAHSLATPFLLYTHDAGCLVVRYRSLNWEKRRLYGEELAE